jgi:hypothetical protein
MARRTIDKVLCREEQRFVFGFLFKSSVAFCTRNCYMFATEPELRLRMIERCGNRRKRFCVVTFPAIRADGCVMLVLMTTYARLRKAEIRFPVMLAYNVKDSGVFDVLSCVTLFAAYRGVLASTSEPRLAMVESVLVEQNRLRIFAKMFLVAGDALLIRNLEVIPALRIDRRFDLLMTRQALTAADFISRLVTLQAVAHSFKLLVCFR